MHTPTREREFIPTLCSGPYDLSNGGGAEFLLRANLQLALSFLPMFEKGETSPGRLQMDTASGDNVTFMDSFYGAT